MPPRAIITADDFGYSDGVNNGIQKAYEEGILTSTSVLANGDAFATLSGPVNRMSFSKPSLGIGVHLTITSGKPLVKDLWPGEEFQRPFFDADPESQWKGSIWKEYISKFSKEHIYHEWKAQIEKVKLAFGTIDHLDSHHGSASYPPARQAYEMLAKEYHLAVRAVSPLSENSVYGGQFLVDTTSIQQFHQMGIPTADTANMNYWHTYSDPIKAFCQDLSSIRPDELREYMFHPAVDASKGAWRMKDLEILTSNAVIDKIKALGIQLTTYAAR